MGARSGAERSLAAIWVAFAAAVPRGPNGKPDYPAARALIAASRGRAGR